MKTYIKNGHEFEELGSFASPCLKCNTAWIYASSHAEKCPNKPDREYQEHAEYSELCRLTSKYPDINLSAHDRILIAKFGGGI